MKQFLIVLFFGALTDCLSVHASSPQEKRDTAVVVIDSLAPYSYHVKHITILLDEKPVHYTVIFDSITNIEKARFHQIHGTTNPNRAIQYYGEKYRKGILAYKEESEGSDE